jgi:hypothetical protein
LAGSKNHEEETSKAASGLMSQDINTWLRALGLAQYCDVFAAGDVDLRVVCTENLIRV